MKGQIVFRRYGLSVAAVAVAAVIRFLAEPAFAGRAGWIAFVLPVALAAWSGGFGPGLVATALSFLVGLYAYFPTSGSAPSTADVAYAVTFVIAGVVVSALAAGLRSGRERAESHAFRAERLQAVAASLSADLTAAEAAEAVLREGIQAFGAGRGVIALLDPGGLTLTIVASVGYDTSDWGRFDHFPVDAQYPVSEAVRLHEPIVIETSEELKVRYPGLLDTIHAGGSALVLPLLDKSEPIGGLYYRFVDVRAFGRDDREYVLALSRLCAAALERARLHDLERRAARRAAFLAQATATLAASLDLEGTVKQVADLAVPAVADFCAVHLLEPDGAIGTIALSGDPARLGLAHRLLELRPPRIDDPDGIGAVVREGKGRIVALLTEEMLRAGIPDEASLATALELEIVAHMSVPLTVGGRSIGAISLTTTAASGRTFDADDMALAGDLATRAALAIENARLYSALVARELQQAAVARLGQLALAEQDLQPLFDATARELASVLEIEFAKILELEPDRRQMRLVAGIGWRPGLVGSATVSSGLESQAGFALEVGGPVIVEDLPTETRFHGPTMLIEHGVVSGMTAAIPGQSGPWGALGVHSTRRRAFTGDDTNFLVAVSNVLAGAIERRRRLDEERQAQDLNRAFIGVVSHELRTPITTIYGGAKMLRRLTPDSSDWTAIATDVEADAERLYRLTEDLLVMTRLERHDLDLGREPVLVSRLLERVVDSERKRWPLAKVRVRIAPELEPVIGEDIYVEQVVRNLVANAAKYSPPDSTIEVSAERFDDEVQVRVLDRGRGIRGEDPDRLFSLFYRAPSTASQASGAGIGLFVCDQLIRAMGGRLWAKAREGGGSEFGFALRRYADDDDLEIEPHEAATVASADGSDGAVGAAGAEGANRASGDNHPREVLLE
ncbi:MAG: GAF domain-containing protein [Chloroflexota bacterium]